MQQLEESLVEGWVIGQAFAREALELDRSLRLIEKFELCIDAEVFKIRPNCTTLVVLSSLLIESKETVDFEETVIIMVIVSIKGVNLIFVSLGDSTKTGTGEIMALILTH